MGGHEGDATLHLSIVFSLTIEARCSTCRVWVRFRQRLPLPSKQWVGRSYLLAITGTDESRVGICVIKACPCSSVGAKRGTFRLVESLLSPVTMIRLVRHRSVVMLTER